jgi:hypothetical protein
MVHLAMQLAPTHAMRKSRLFVMVISSPIILHSPLLTLLGVQPIVMLSVSHKRVDLSPTLFLVCLLASSTSVVAKRPADGSPLAETSLGPEHDPYNVLDHIIPNVLTGITFGALEPSTSFCVSTLSDRKVLYSPLPSRRLCVCLSGMHDGWQAWSLGRIVRVRSAATFAIKKC